MCRVGPVHREQLIVMNNSSRERDTCSQNCCILFHLEYYSTWVVGMSKTGPSFTRIDQYTSKKLQKLIAKSKQENCNIFI